MPLYLYECENNDCPCGGTFRAEQHMTDDALTVCPHCGGPVSRLITPVTLSVPIGDTDLKGHGFAKLVRRDKGVYENVTRLDGESRYYHYDKPQTMPDIKRRIAD